MVAQDHPGAILRGKLTYREINCSEISPRGCPVWRTGVKDHPVGTMCDKLKYIEISCPEVSPRGSPARNMIVKNHLAAVLCDKLAYLEISCPKYHPVAPLYETWFLRITSLVPCATD